VTVVLEGPDGGGKSTLATLLQARYGAGYQHAGPPIEGWTANDMTKYYLAMVSGMLFTPGTYPRLPREVFADDASFSQYEEMRTRDEDQRLRTVIGSTVIDRWALGETVYGPIFRGRSLVTPLSWALLCDVLDELCVPLVLCLPGQDVAMENWRQRRDAGGEHFDDAVKVAQAYKNFQTFADDRTGYRRPRWCWTYDYNNAEDTVEMLHFLDGLQERQR